MKRSAVVVLSIILSVLAVPASAKKSELCVTQQAAKKKTLKCPTQKDLNKKGIAACPDYRMRQQFGMNYMTVANSCLSTQLLKRPF
jgi:hypothetical protein